MKFWKKKKQEGEPKSNGPAKPRTSTDKAAGRRDGQGSASTVTDGEAG